MKISVLLNEEKYKMKFDVVIGNPPFNAEAGDERINSANTNNSNIYAEFISIGISLVKDNGKLVFITPASWMQSSTHRNIRTEMLNNGLKSITEIDPSLFPNVGIRAGITSWVIDKTHNQSITIETIAEAPKNALILDTAPMNLDEIISEIKIADQKGPKKSQRTVRC